MAEPYVQFLFNFTTRQPEGTTSFAPGGPPPPNAMFWQITSDATGKVVIRDRALAVLGTGTWRFNATIDRVHDRDAKRVDDERWNAIDSLLYTLLEQARANGPADPTFVDAGEVAHATAVLPPPAPMAPAEPVPPAPTIATPPAPAPKRGVIAKILGGLALVGLVIVVGVAVYLWGKVDKKLGNGASCTFSVECASKRCYSGKCRADYDHELRNGSHCELSSECASGHCSANDVCY